ncbi:lipase family protein [Thermomonospora cellulosilytica]|uniref:Triacylglycerol lipase n=1 Tax=Thermomonospora cellulosilytica TaxID=1411118 RepID=A0A7W3R7R7_9ACTN|nr:lipase family protein [Thermomonospora cellulosilytica]MBA9002640.1 triacylglycerol lipase [Thermomonospora cellulosilytica]
MRLSRLLTTALAGAVLAGTGLVAPPTVSAAPAAASAPLACLASDADIYTAPDRITGNPGDLLSCRRTELPQIPGNVPMKAWKIKYVSTDVKGNKIAVSGFVAIPDARWTGGGSRPTVAFTPGTLGSGGQCALSKQMAGEQVDSYEAGNLRRFLEAGFAVAASDGVGYMTGQVHTYTVGLNAGHALLDAVRASRQIPGGSLTADGKVGIAGYSEGGFNTLWAAQLASSYAPELNVVGAAAGGVPGDLKLVAERLNGSAFAGFLADAVVGLSAAHPEMPFDELLNDRGRQAVEDVRSNCLFGTLGAFAFQRLENFSTDRLSLEQIYALRGSTGRTWGEVIDDQKVGVGIGPASSAARYKIGFPVYQYRGALEEIIPHEAEDGVFDRYCAAGITTEWRTYAGEHLTTDWLASGDVTRFLGDRFAGRPPVNDC